MKPRYFLAAVGDTVGIQAKARTLAVQYTNELPDHLRLKRVSEQFGVNIATLVQYECLLNHAQHGQFIKEVDAANTNPVEASNLPELFIVPGLFYQQHSSLGADAKLLVEIAKRFNIKCTLVPTKSRGGIAQNSEIIQQFLQANAAKPYWLAAVSRGGAEVKWMLNNYPEAGHLQHLCGWVNLNGIVNGSRVMESAESSPPWRMFYRTVARLSGVNPVLVDELQPAVEAWSKTQLPEHASYVNLISMPLNWDVCAPVQSRYKKLVQYGPNDGTVLLCDYWREPGLCYPVLGVDHLMRSTNLSRIFYQLINRLLLDKTPLPKVR